MIAEIYNKISETGSNLSDRLEDKLTGDFFGVIRYLPFEIGLKLILSKTRFNSTEQMDWEQALSKYKGYSYNIGFWPNQPEGEIDLMLTSHQITIGIEVKYCSGLSSEDEETDTEILPEESCNQLARYSRMLSRIGVGTTCLIFLAPFEMMIKVRKSISERSIIASNISLGYLSWEDVLESLQNYESRELEEGQRLIIQDLIKLLVKKGFQRFSGFSTGINRIVTEQSYAFTGAVPTQSVLIWPTTMVTKGVTYVFNK